MTQLCHNGAWLGLIYVCARTVCGICGAYEVHAWGESEEFEEAWWGWPVALYEPGVLDVLFDVLEAGPFDAQTHEALFHGLCAG